MAEWKPVRIPYKDGKTVIASRGASRYVLYETEQKYDPGKQYYIPIRKVIGTQIPEQPEFMLPNEKYRELFPDINASKNMELENYVRERDRTARARAYFDQVYFEFMMLSRRMPERRLSANKARRINRVLRPMMELLETAGMPDTDFLSLCSILGTEPGLMNFKLLSMRKRGLHVPLSGECDSRFLDRNPI